MDRLMDTGRVFHKGFFFVGGDVGGDNQFIGNTVQSTGNSLEV